jgi:hypothetical protein
MVSPSKTSLQSVGENGVMTSRPTRRLINSPLAATMSIRAMHHSCANHDSNPGASCPANGFQDRRLRPLGHPPGAILAGSRGRSATLTSIVLLRLRWRESVVRQNVTSGSLIVPQSRAEARLRGGRHECRSSRCLRLISSVTLHPLSDMGSGDVCCLVAAQRCRTEDGSDTSGREEDGALGDRR